MKKILLTILILTISISAFANFSITKKGKPNATVIKPKEITKAQEYAINAFITYIEKISGATLPTSETPTGKNDIYIGQTEPTKNLLKDFDFKSLKTDGIYIRCNGKDRLIITGDEKAGEIYAVYSFLEEFLGVKYYLSDEELIPSNKSISLKKIDYKYIPKMFSRESFYKECYKNMPDYALKLKQNGHGYYKIPAEYGGNVKLIGFAHTFTYLMDPKVYSKDHPEWFAIHNGVRNFGDRTAQLCLTNKEMVAELTKNVLKDIEKHPNDKIFSVTQYDNRNYCECDNCKALTEKYGHSGALLSVINEIAKVVKEKYPDKYLETFAYSYTQEAPKGGFKPADNVIIRLCSIRANFAKPFDDPSNEPFMKDLRDWSKLASNLYIWDYSVGYFNHLMPYPNTQVLQKDFQILVDNKAVAMFSEGDEANRNAWLLKYKGYIIAKLCWDCNIDIDKETKGFCDFYYGKAGDDMYKYIKHIEKSMEHVDTPLICHMYNIKYWTYDEWAKGFEILNSALKKVKGNQKYEDRVMIDLLSHTAGALTADRDTYLKLAESGLMPCDNSIDLLDKYRSYEESQEIPSPEEHYVWNNHFTSALTDKKTGPVPNECKGLDNKQWVDYKPENVWFGFNRINEKFVEIKDDPNASTGKYIIVKGDQKDWHFMSYILYLFGSKYNYADVYMTYKVDSQAEYAKDAYSVGVYSPTTKYAINVQVPSNDTPDGKFKTRNFGTIDLSKVCNDAYFFVAGNGHGNTSKNMTIDRIFFIYHN